MKICKKLAKTSNVCAKKVENLRLGASKGCLGSLQRRCNICRGIVTAKNGVVPLRRDFSIIHCNDPVTIPVTITFWESLQGSLQGSLQ